MTDFGLSVSPAWSELDAMHAFYRAGGAERLLAPQAVYRDAICPACRLSTADAGNCTRNTPIDAPLIELINLDCGGKRYAMPRQDCRHSDGIIRGFDTREATTCAPQ